MPLTVLVAVALSVAALVVVLAGIIVTVQRRQVRTTFSGLVDTPGRPLPDLLIAVAGELRRQRRAAGENADMLARISEALSAVPEGVVVCDEHGTVRYRNEIAQSFAGARHGEALADLAVTELLDAALRRGPAEQTLELYGPPRRALLIRAIPLGDGPLSEGERTLGAVAIIEDVSERRRLEAIRRDFVANVSHELKSPVGALGILAETMQAEDEPAVSRRLAERMQ